MKVKIRRLHPEAIVPSYAKDGDAAMDLYATEVKEDKYGNYVYLTGFSFEIPKGYLGLLFPRSSISKTSMSLANSVGVVDSGYRGEIMLKFRQNVDASSIYKTGDRVGQMLIIPHPKIVLMEVNELSTTDRGEGGFGSTGQ